MASPHLEMGKAAEEKAIMEMRVVPEYHLLFTLGLPLPQFCYCPSLSQWYVNAEYVCAGFNLVETEQAFSIKH